MKKGSFFRRLTGSIKLSDEDEDTTIEESKYSTEQKTVRVRSEGAYDEDNSDFKEEEQEGQLTVDLYQTQREIIVQSMIAGVVPENLNITITRDTVIIKGKREEMRGMDEENYVVRELYWGNFSRTLTLPCEVEPEDADAFEKHGLLTIKIPKIDKDKQTNLKVKSM